MEIHHMSQHDYLPIFPAYVYKITHRDTGQFYYGSRKTNQSHNRMPNDDLWVHYFTSSSKVKELVNQQGKDAFDTQIIFTFGDYDVCYWYEQLMIFSSKGTTLCMNIHCVDPNTGNYAWSAAGKTKSAEHRAKIGKAHKGKHVTNDTRTLLSQARSKTVASAETRKKMSESRKGSNTGEANPMFGKTWSDAHKAKIREQMKGEKNPNYGKTHTDEAKAKMSAARKGKSRKMSQETKDKLSVSKKDKPGKTPSAEQKAKRLVSYLAACAKRRQLREQENK
jgi:hypothetical protein